MGINDVLIDRNLSMGSMYEFRMIDIRTGPNSKTPISESSMCEGLLYPIGSMGLVYNYLHCYILGDLYGFHVGSHGKNCCMLITRIPEVSRM